MIYWYDNQRLRRKKLVKENVQGIRIRLREKLGFFLFSGASNIIYQFKSLYYLFFLTEVLHINILAAGTVLAVGTVWDAVNDPLLGYWAQNHKFKSGERIRPFALWYAVPLAVSVVLMFTDFRLAESGAVIAALVIYILFEVFNTFIAIPYNSMASLATDSDAERRSINVYRNLGGCFGSGIGAVACLPLLKLFGALDGSGNLIPDRGSRGFLSVAVLMGFIVALGCVSHYLTTKERIRPINAQEKLSGRQIAGMLLRSKSWVLNTLYVLVYGILNLLVMSNIAYYATYVMHSTGAATAIMAVYLVVAIAVSFAVAPIDKKIGRRNTMILGAAMYIAGKVWFTADPYSMGAIYVNAVSVGVAATITFVLFNTNRNNLVDIIEWREGARLDSMVSTSDNLASKLAAALATWLMSLWMSRAGFVSGAAQQPESAIKVINSLLGWVPMVLGVIMLLIVLRIDIQKEYLDIVGEKAKKTAP